VTTVILSREDGEGSPASFLLAALRQLPAAVVVAEASSGRIAFANEQVAKILRGSAVPAEPLERALRGERIVREDVRVVRGDGTAGAIRVIAAPIFDDAGAQVAAVLAFIDVSEEWKEREALDSLDLDATLKSIARMAIPGFADIAFVYLLDEHDTLTRHEVAAADAAEEERVRRLWERFPINAAPLVDTIKRGRPRLTPRVKEEMWSFVADDDQRRAMMEVGIRSTLTIPLHGGGASFGAMVFARTSERAYEEPDVVVANELARRAAAAIERSRLYNAERAQRIRAEESTARLEHLQALTSALTVAITTDDVLDALVAEMRDLAGAKTIAVGLLDESGALRIVRTAGVPPQAIGYFDRVPREPLWGDAHAVVPLRAPDRVIGAVALTFGNEQTIPEPLRNFILSVARQSAQAIERARLFDSEHRARQEAEHASRAKDEFLAILSHELRTPMTTVIGWADLLRLTYEGGDPSIVTAIESLRAGALAQARLIDDLLDVSRIITGKLQVDKREMDLAASVVSAAETLRITAETKGLTLRVDGDGPMLVDADPARMRQIVMNLVANAVKFTPRGGEVGVSVQRRDGVAEIVVRDTGEGISPDFLPHVFERFRQASVGDSRLHTGLGLGLSIVHHLVQLHGGSVRAESDGVGKGATFTVTLPVKDGGGRAQGAGDTAAS
jgi:signal transduction histidine kinase